MNTYCDTESETTGSEMQTRWSEYSKTTDTCYTCNIHYSLDVRTVRTPCVQINLQLWQVYAHMKNITKEKETLSNCSFNSWNTIYEPKKTLGSRLPRVHAYTRIDVDSCCAVVMYKDTKDSRPSCLKRHTYTHTISYANKNCLM